jgi:hypothetical protein
MGMTFTLISAQHEKTFFKSFRPLLNKNQKAKESGTNKNTQMENYLNQDSNTTLNTLLFTPLGSDQSSLPERNFLEKTSYFW